MNPAIFCGSLALLSGGTILVGGTRGLVRAVRSKTWPQVEGSITSSAVIREPCADSNTRFRLRASIHYTYGVKGGYYRGNRVRFVNLGTGDVEAVVARYPVGKTVRIFYSPSDTSLSVLEPGANWFQFLVVPAALAFIAAGVAMLVQGRK